MDYTSIVEQINSGQGRNCFKKPSQAEIDYLKSLELPEEVIGFYRDYTPIDIIEVNDVRLLPISEIIEDGIDGFLVRPADVQTLSQLLDRLISDNQAERELIGEKARSKVIEVFNRQKMIDSLINAYVQILQNSGKFKHRATLKSFFSKFIKTV